LRLGSSTGAKVGGGVGGAVGLLALLAALATYIHFKENFLPFSSSGLS
jgi:hypothetical protein